MERNESFKEILKKRRKDLKLRQADVGDAIGVTSVTVGYYESGKAHPALETLEKLCAVLELDFLKMRALINDEKRNKTIVKAQKDAIFPVHTFPAREKPALYNGAETTTRQGSERDKPVGTLTILQASSADVKNKIYYLVKEEMSIGRHPENDIVILDPDKHISRHHALVCRTKNGFVLEDKGSTNGTMVNRNRKQIGQHSLEDGDVILLPNTVLQFNDLCPTDFDGDDAPALPEGESS
jgi:transcriptional regulator with XRE-family HTH domain